MGDGHFGTAHRHCARGKASRGSGILRPCPRIVLFVHGNLFVVDHDLAELHLAAAVGPLGRFAGIQRNAGTVVVLQVGVKAVVARWQRIARPGEIGYLEGKPLGQVTVVVQLLFLEGLGQRIGKHHRVRMRDGAVVPIVTVAVVLRRPVMLANVHPVKSHIEVVSASERSVVVVVVAQHQAGIHALAGVHAVVGGGYEGARHHVAHMAAPMAMAAPVATVLGVPVLIAPDAAEVHVQVALGQAAATGRIVGAASGSVAAAEHAGGDEGAASAARGIVQGTVQTVHRLVGIAALHVGAVGALQGLVAGALVAGVVAADFRFGDGVHLGGAHVGEVVAKVRHEVQRLAGALGNGHVLDAAVHAAVHLERHLLHPFGGIGLREVVPGAVVGGVQHSGGAVGVGSEVAAVGGIGVLAGEGVLLAALELVLVHLQVIGDGHYRVLHRGAIFQLVAGNRVFVAVRFGNTGVVGGVVLVGGRAQRGHRIALLVGLKQVQAEVAVRGEIAVRGHRVVLGAVALAGIVALFVRGRLVLHRGSGRIHRVGGVIGVLDVFLAQGEHRAVLVQHVDALHVGNGHRANLHVVGVEHGGGQLLGYVQRHAGVVGFRAHIA